jgi:AcrR family transcriptional regulator
VSTPGRRGPYARTKERRRAIADAALALVVERGHRSLTTLAVATRAGISEPGLLYHYPSKEAVLVAALERFDEQQLSQLSPGEALESAPERAALGVRRTNIVHLYTALMAEASNPEHPAHHYFKERWRVGREIPARDIALLQEAGEVDASIDPQRAATWILAAWDGLQSHWLVDPGFDIDVELRMLIEVVLGRSSATGRKRVRARSAQGTR